jgi:hypothetical protein
MGTKSTKCYRFLCGWREPVTPWAISLLKPAFIGCNTLALNPAVNAPNIPCFKSPHMRRQALVAKPTHGHKEHKIPFASYHA